MVTMKGKKATEEGSCPNDFDFLRWIESMMDLLFAVIVLPRGSL
jgi:hypothetical protein